MYSVSILSLFLDMRMEYWAHVVRCRQTPSRADIHLQKHIHTGHTCLHVETHAQMHTHLHALTHKHVDTKWT